MRTGPVDAALMQKVLDVAELERGADIHHHLQADDLGAGPEVPEGTAPGHPNTQRARRARLDIALTEPSRLLLEINEGFLNSPDEKTRAALICRLQGALKDAGRQS